jgi:hypothetical protein
VAEVADDFLKSSIGENSGGDGAAGKPISDVLDTNLPTRVYCARLRLT